MVAVRALFAQARQFEASLSGELERLVKKWGERRSVLRQERQVLKWERDSR